jgi:hypothetical protein
MKDKWLTASEWASTLIPAFAPKRWRRPGTGIFRRILLVNTTLWVALGFPLSLYMPGGFAWVAWFPAISMGLFTLLAPSQEWWNALQESKKPKALEEGSEP